MDSWFKGPAGELHKRLPPFVKDKAGFSWVIIRAPATSGELGGGASVVNKFFKLLLYSIGLG